VEHTERILKGMNYMEVMLKIGLLMDCLICESLFLSGWGVRFLDSQTTSPRSMRQLTSFRSLSCLPYLKSFAPFSIRILPS
jgi:hypothetical protein